MEIKIESIVPNENQPRRFFDTASLNELAESIKKHGLLENLIVRSQNDKKTIPKGKYELICGERRYRASKIAGVTMVTATVKEMTDKEAYELSLTENLQRDNLSPIEEAEAYKRLQEFYTQGDIAKLVNKNRTRINQVVQLLELPKEIHPFFSQFGSITPLTERHGRELLRFKRFLDTMVTADTDLCYHIHDDWYLSFTLQHGGDVHTFFEYYCCRNVKHKKIKDCLLFDVVQGTYFTDTSFKDFSDRINWFMYDAIRSSIMGTNEADMKKYESTVLEDLRSKIKNLSDDEKTKFEWITLQRDLLPMSSDFIPSLKNIPHEEIKMPKEKEYLANQLSKYYFAKKYGIIKDSFLKLEEDMIKFYFRWADEHGLLKDLYEENQEETEENQEDEIDEIE